MMTLIMMTLQGVVTIIQLQPPTSPEGHVLTHPGLLQCTMIGTIALMMTIEIKIIVIMSLRHKG